ncbi:MAG: adenylosuccinate lyase, partial [Arsenophonus sp. ER-LPS3-MAG3]
LLNQLNHVANVKLVISLLSDLTDSTVLRNLGVAIGYALIAYQSTLNGLTKLEVNKKNLKTELNDNWEVITEGIQTVMRRYGIKRPYEKLKTLTRGKHITAENIKTFIDNLDLPKTEKKRLKKMTPSNYIGYSTDLVKHLDKVNR